MLTLILLVTFANAEIIDYTHSDYIPISDGEVVLWDTYGHLKHVINLTEYSILVEESYQFLHIFPASHMINLLEADFDHINQLLKTISIQPRVTRSIHFLGTALKVIAGTPDFDDFQTTNIKIEELIDANKQQV